jgi:chitin disaccharide deacetylase
VTAMDGTRTVALCADDYALSPGVSAGILEALRAGRLSAVSVMASMPRWPELAPELKPVPDADVGLHVNLTLGAPLGAMPSLAPDGRFPPVAQVIRAAVLGRAPLAEIRAELDRQLDRFEAAMGRPPDFVDGHQHVHALPGVRAVLLETLAARGLQGACWLRDCGDRWDRIVARRHEASKALIVAGFARGFAAAARRAGFPVNEGFAGFSPFDPAQDYARQFERFLQAPGRAHLVMCHPGHADAELRALDPVTTTRERELAFLLSERFDAALERRGLRLARLPRPAR